MKAIIVLFILLAAAACFLASAFSPASPRLTPIGLTLLAGGLAIEASPLP